MVADETAGLNGDDTSDSSQTPRGERNGRPDVTLESSKAATPPSLLTFQPPVRGGERGRPIVPLCFVIDY